MVCEFALSANRGAQRYFRTPAAPRPDLFQRLALPIVVGQIKVPGIKIHDTRIIRLMEILLHSGTKITGWRTAEVHQAILTSFGLKPATYTLTQLRYDVRKMKAHGLIERHGKRYAYRLTDKGDRSPSCSSFSTSASAVRSPTASSSASPHQPPQPAQNSKRRIEKQTSPSTRFFSSSPPENLREKFSNPEFKNLIELRRAASPTDSQAETDAPVIRQRPCRAGDPHKRGVIDVAIRVSKVRRVRQIKRLRFECQLESLRDQEITE